jgi:hypothetical protein
LSLRDRLDAEYLRSRGKKHHWHQKDEDALRAVLAAANGDHDEIVRVWAVGLAREKYPRCDRIRDLAEHWNTYASELAKSEPPSPSAAVLPDTPAGRAWGSLLKQFLTDGRNYAVEQLRSRLQAIDLRGAELVLEAADRYARTWTLEHYGGLLTDALAAQGLTVSIIAPEGEEAAP